MGSIKDILLDMMDIIDDLRLDMRVIEKLRIGDKIREVSAKIHDLEEDNNDTLY